MRPISQRRVVLTLAFALLGSTAAQADLQDALKAYDSGQYEAARAQFLTLAALGNGNAQYNLGAMALHGQGGTKDMATGVGWLLAAADNGFQRLKPEQLMAMQSGLTVEQRGVAQDIVDHYGHAALLKTVLPSTGARCPDVKAARLVQAAPATYPIIARRLSLDGIVMVDLTVGTDGLAKDPEILMTAPSEEFPAAAVESFLQSRFVPATRLGAPVESRCRLKMSFSLYGGGRLWNVGALKKIREDAAEGAAYAEYVVGLAATLDPTVGISFVQANQLILAAAQGGQPQAQYLIARRFEGVPPCGDGAKRSVWMQAAATSGDATAQLALATDVLNGTPSAEDISRAKSLLQQASHSDSFYVRKHVTALMAASSVSAIRDPAAALVLAKKLQQDHIQSDPQMFEVLAAAQAVNGKFSSARSQQEEAIRKAKALYWNTSVMEERLAAYRRSQPWFGDLFSVPPTTSSPPDLIKTLHLCASSTNQHCWRKVPDQPTVPTGTRIPQ